MTTERPPANSLIVCKLLFHWNTQIYQLENNEWRLWNEYRWKFANCCDVLMVIGVCLFCGGYDIGSCNRRGFAEAIRWTAWDVTPPVVLLLVAKHRRRRFSPGMTQKAKAIRHSPYGAVRWEQKLDDTTFHWTSKPRCLQKPKENHSIQHSLRVSVMSSAWLLRQDKCLARMIIYVFDFHEAIFAAEKCALILSDQATLFRCDVLSGFVFPPFCFVRPWCRSTECCFAYKKKLIEFVIQHDWTRGPMRNKQI